MIDDIVLEWYELQRSLTKLKAKEMELRKEIASFVMNGHTSKSHTLELCGYELRAENKFTYSLDKKMLMENMDHLTITDKEAIKWTPSIIIKKYEALENSWLKDKMVTLKPAAPTLKVVSVLE